MVFTRRGQTWRPPAPRSSRGQDTPTQPSGFTTIRRQGAHFVTDDNGGAQRATSAHAPSRPHRDRRPRYPAPRDRARQQPSQPLLVPELLPDVPRSAPPSDRTLRSAVSRRLVDAQSRALDVHTRQRRAARVVRTRICAAICAATKSRARDERQALRGALRRDTDLERAAVRGDPSVHRAEPCARGDRHECSGLSLVDVPAAPGTGGRCARDRSDLDAPPLVDRPGSLTRPARRDLPGTDRTPSGDTSRDVCPSHSPTLHAGRRTSGPESRCGSTS